MLYLWFITNGPARKGGDIAGDFIREMAVEFTKDSRFEVSSNLKFSNGWFEGFKKWYNIKRYTRQGEGASSDAALIECRPVHSSRQRHAHWGRTTLSKEEAVDIVLSHDSEETCINTPSVEEPSDATRPPTPPSAAASVVNLKIIIDHLHDVQEECMTRNDLGDITETLGSLILQIEMKQHARTAQTSITSFFQKIV